MNNGCLLEVRPAAGGEEAKIWVKDLIRMYLRFSQSQNWKTEFLTETTLKIEGDHSFRLLKNESGVHRVQRIPLTERHGRIHTSTATVVVFPQLTDFEIKINPQDLEWQFYRASSKGGQNVQKVSSAVRVIHRPTGVIAQSEQERFQTQNRELALTLLRGKLWEQEELKKEQTIAGYRSAVGRGMRAEKIRTYNYPQNRVTDHRLGKKFRLEDIIDGRLINLTTLLA